jgi:hypothetical protein
MVPAVDSVVNDGACSPIKGMRKFLSSVFAVGRDTAYISKHIMQD